MDPEGTFDAAEQAGMPLDAPGWDGFFNRLSLLQDTDPRRAEVLRWAYEQLRSTFDDDWLTRAQVSSEPPSLPRYLGLAPFHNVAFADVLEWALRLRTIADLRGCDEVVAELRGDATEGRVSHGALQSRLAGGAARLGWAAELEPSAGATKPADIEFFASTGPIRVETKVLGMSDVAQGLRLQTDAVRDRVSDLGVEYDAWIEGRFDRLPDERETDALVSSVAVWASGRRAPQPWATDGIDLTIVDRHGPCGRLTWRGEQTETWPRLARILRKKAKQMRDSGAQWLCVEIRSGMWRDTRWSRSDLQSKLGAVVEALHATFAFDPPDGIVLMSPVGPNVAGVDDDFVVLGAAAGLRRRIEPGRIQETLIVPLQRNTSAAVDDWFQLADAQSTWLEWALAAAGLPQFSEIV